jgi:ribosomal protein S18 acetylase RimI-like enzyme
VYVYTMAVNEKARSLYDKCGFAVEREESFAHAKGRGGCLDGVEGRARVVLLKATQAAQVPSSTTTPPSSSTSYW